MFPTLCIHPLSYLTPNSWASHLPTFILLLPPPPVTTSLFCISVSLVLFCYICWFVVFFRFYIYMMSYSMLSKSIHVAGNSKILCVLMSE